GPHMVAGPLLAERLYGGAGGWALIGVIQAAGAVAGGALGLRWKPRQPLGASVAPGALMTPYLAAFARGGPRWLVCVRDALVGAHGPVALTRHDARVQQRMPDAAHSGVAARSGMRGLVALPPGAALAGILAAHVGGGPLVIAAAGWLAVSALVTL